jgi:hypothetical protein
VNCLRRLVVTYVLPLALAGLCVALALVVIVWPVKPAHGAEQYGTRWLARDASGQSPTIERATAADPTPLSAGVTWSGLDYIRQAAITALFIVDWAQTRYIGTHCDQYQEAGVVLSTVAGSCPNLKKLAVYYPIVMAGHAFVASRMERENRDIFQTGTIVVQTAVVMHNRNIGVGVYWPW